MHEKKLETMNEKSTRNGSLYNKTCGIQYRILRLIQVCIAKLTKAKIREKNSYEKKIYQNVHKIIPTGNSGNGCSSEVESEILQF